MTDKYSKEVLQDWIDKLHDETELIEELSVWETDFVDSLESQLRRKGYLTDRQVEVLEDIYTKKTK